VFHKSGVIYKAEGQGTSNVSLVELNRQTVLALNFDGALELLGKNSMFKGFGDPLIANFFQVLHLRSKLEDDV